MLVLGDPVVTLAPFPSGVHVHDDRAEVWQMVRELGEHEATNDHWRAQKPPPVETSVGSTSPCACP